MGNGESSLWGIEEWCEWSSDGECVEKIAEYLNYTCRHLPFQNFFGTMFSKMSHKPVQNRAEGCAWHTESLSITPFAVRFARWIRFCTQTDLDPPSTVLCAVVPTVLHCVSVLCARVACAIVCMCMCVCVCVCVYVCACVCFHWCVWTFWQSFWYVIGKSPCLCGSFHPPFA